MYKAFSIFVSASIVILSGGQALAASLSLIDSELRLRTQAQATPDSELFVTSFPTSAIVSESEVEFPDVESLFDPSAGVPPGFASSLVNVAIDAGSDFLDIDFDNIGSGFRRYASGFENTYVFSFSPPIALQITGATIDPLTTLGLTPDRVSFDGSELFVNVQGLSFDPNSFARINLTTMAVEPPPEPPIVTPPEPPVTVPEPGMLSSLTIAALCVLGVKRRHQVN